MSKIVIKKRIDLAFLGSEYAEAYLSFRAVPLSDYEQLIQELPKADPRYIELVTKAKQDSLTPDEHDELVALRDTKEHTNTDSLHTMLIYLKRYFIAGEFPNDKGELENITDPEELAGLDQETALKCFNVLMGQDTSPKDGA